MAEKHPGTESFNNQFKNKGITVDGVLNGNVDLQRAKNGKDINNAFAVLFEQNPNLFSELMNKTASSHVTVKNAAEAGKPVDDFVKGMKEQKRAEVRNANLQALDQIYRSIQSPEIGQRIDSNRTFAMTPFPVNSIGTPVFNTAADAQRMIGYYATDQRGPQKMSQGDVDLSAVNDVMNSRMLPGFNGDGTIRFQKGGIWGQVNSGINGSVYGDYNTNAQAAIEKFEVFNERFSNPNSRGHGFIALDIETLGAMGKTATNDEWFHITEVAATHYDYDKKTKGVSNKETFSWFAKPAPNLQAEMLETIASIEQNPSSFQSLTDAKRRSLVDLALYSTAQVESNQGFTPASFEKKSGTTGLNIIHSNIKELDGLVTPQGVNNQVIMQNFSSFATHMRSGLENMNAHGDTLDSVMGNYNKLVDRHKAKFFITFNGDKFDIPGLNRFGGNTPMHHLDWLSVGRTVAKNPMEWQEALGRKDLPYEQGPETLYEYRRSLGLSTDGAHIATADVGDDGMGGVVLKSREIVAERIAAGRVGTLSQDGTRKNTSELSYADLNAKKGQMFFSTSGVYNNGDKYKDFQGQYIDGKLEPTGRKGDVLNAESFYQMTGVRKVENEEKYIMELYNPDADTASYIIREGENARHEMNAFVNANLKTADEMMEGGQDAITGLRNTDLARRRYDGLFGLQQGMTKGYDAAKRMFGNVDVFRQNFDGGIDNLTDLDRANLTEKMNFDSLYNPQEKSFSFNQSEADAFWKMLPRLDSEREAYGIAFDRIDQMVPVNPDKERWAQKDDNIMRSLMLKEFGSNLDALAGGEQMETRAALPYEQYMLPYKDRISGKERTLNLSDPSIASNQIKSYIYGQQQEFKGDKAKQRQVAGELYLTLVSSLNEAGVIPDNEVMNLAREYQNNPGVSPSAFADKLADSLVRNEELLEGIKRETITEKSMRSVDAVKNLEVADILTAADNGVQIGLGVRGSTTSSPKAGGGLHYHPAYLTEEMQKMFQQLDAPHAVTGLVPNNQKAVMAVLETFMNQGDLSHGVGYALTAKSDNSAVFINMFDETQTTQVLGGLRAGNVPDNVVQVAIPMISRNGTMRHEGMVVNANSDIIRDKTQPSGFRKASSVERLAESFQGWPASQILKGVKDPGKRDFAQGLSNRQTMDSVQLLSGIRRNAKFGENDGYVFKNTLADVGKQSHVDFAPAMIHQMYEAGMLKREGEYGHHLNASAFTRDDELKTRFDYEKDITPSMKELISRNAAGFASEHAELIGGETDLSFVKEDRAWNTRALVSGRRSIPFGEYGPHTRPNVTQAANSHPISPEVQRNLLEVGEKGGTYVNFDTFTTTPEREAAMARVGGNDKSHMNIKLAIMDERDLQNRVQEMHQAATPEGLDLLEKEGLLNPDGSLASERLPTMYEQQVVMNRELMEQMQMERTKNLDVDIEKSREVAADLVDETTGRYQVGASVRPGQVVGVDANGKNVYFDGSAEGTIAFDDGRVSVKYQEPVHKVINDIEKGTFSAGDGFSHEFMKAITGIDGVGAMIHPDFEKHGDYHHQLRGQMNRVANEMKGMEPEQFEEKKNFLENFFRSGDSDAMALRVIKEGDDVRIEESLGKAGVKEFSSQQLTSILGEFGLSEMQAMPENAYGISTNHQTLGLIQAMSFADVSNHSSAAGEDGGHVTQGYREIAMMRRQGLNETADYIQEAAVKAAKERTGTPGAGGISDYNRGLGMIDSLKALNGELAPEADDKVFQAGDFKPAPLTDKNRATYTGTVHDTHSIQDKVKYNPALSKQHGFWLGLPEFNEEGMDIQVEGKKVDKLFIPHENLEGSGNEVWKSETQKINEKIIERARAVEEAKVPGISGKVDKALLTTERGRLQSAVTDFHKQLRTDLTSSQGHFGKNIFRTQMPNSASGIAKMISPEYTAEIGSHVAFISPQDAKSMGVDELIQKSEGPIFGQVLRNPTFHDQATQVAEIRIGTHLLEGQQQITAILADALRADADGDQLRTTVINDEAVQAELAERHSAQVAEQVGRLQRKGATYDQAPQSEIEKLTLLDKNHKPYLDGSAHDDFSFEGITKGGVAHAIDPTDAVVSSKESYAKFGKQIVGMASNLNLRYTQMAQKHFDMKNPNEAAAFDSIREFFEGQKGLEQRIISAKNDKGVAIEGARHSGLELIEALQARRFDQALEIDQSDAGLGGYFTENAQMERAIPAMQMLESRAGRSAMQEEFMGFGLRSGVSDKISDQQILDVMKGQTRNRPDASMFLNMLSEMNGTPVDTSYLYEDDAVRPTYDRTPGGAQYVEPQGNGAARVPVTVNEMTPNYGERGASKIGSAITEAMGTKAGKGFAIAGAIGLGALMLSNLSSGDSITPESRPHNDETIQGSQPVGPPVSQTARVQMNDSGYNGLRVSVSGQAPGNFSNEQIGSLANGALQTSGIQTNVNIRSQDDTSVMNQQWVQQQFSELLNQG